MIVKQEQLLASTETKQQLARALRNQYLNQWRKKNPSKVKEYRQNFWERRAGEILTSANNN